MVHIKCQAAFTQKNSKNVLEMPSSVVLILRVNACQHGGIERNSYCKSENIHIDIIILSAYKHKFITIMNSIKPYIHWVFVCLFVLRFYGPVNLVGSC